MEDFFARPVRFVREEIKEGKRVLSFARIEGGEIFGPFLVHSFDPLKLLRSIRKMVPNYCAWEGFWVTSKTTSIMLAVIGKNDAVILTPRNRGKIIQRIVKARKEREGNSSLPIGK